MEASMRLAAGFVCNSLAGTSFIGKCETRKSNRLMQMVRRQHRLPTLLSEQLFAAASNSANVTGDLVCTTSDCSSLSFQCPCLITTPMSKAVREDGAARVQYTPTAPESL